MFVPPCTCMCNRSCYGTYNLNIFFSSTITPNYLFSLKTHFYERIIKLSANLLSLEKAVLVFYSTTPIIGLNVPERHIRTKNHDPLILTSIWDFLMRGTRLPLRCSPRSLPRRFWSTGHCSQTCKNLL